MGVNWVVLSWVICVKVGVSVCWGGGGLGRLGVMGMLVLCLGCGFCVDVICVGEMVGGVC